MVQPPGKPKLQRNLILAITLLVLCYGSFGACFVAPYFFMRPLKPREERAPLHEAVQLGDEQEVTRILSFNSDPNALDLEGNSPLWYALSEGQLAVADLLVKAGANVNEVSREGRTLLQRIQELRSQKYISAEQVANCERALQWLREHNAPLKTNPTATNNLWNFSRTIEGLATTQVHTARGCRA